MPTLRCLAVAAATVMTLTFAVRAAAQDQLAPSEAPEVAPAAAKNLPFATPSVDDATLQSVAGREDYAQQANAAQVAGVSQNSVGDNVRTGDATIADSAFQNLSGLSVLNVNTGNNVAINAAMNVNIAITPGQ